MKILFAANTPNSKTAGIAKIMNCLAESLTAQGDQVDLLFRENVPAFSSFRRISDFLFPILAVQAIRTHWKQKGRHDLIALHSLAGSFYVFLRTLFKTLPPCVIVSYGSDEMRWELEKEEESLGFRKIRFFSKIFYYNIMIRQARYATRHADHVMVAARCEIDYYEKKYGMPRKKVSFIPNGVSPEYFISRQNAGPLRKLLFLGGWEWRKGIRYLAEAFSLLAEENPELTLSLVGIGVDAETAQKIFPPEFRSRIFVISKVSASETIQVYAAHDIFVFPSLFESMSLVVPEAMAAGMPVVTTKACGMQDIIEDGIQGLLVRPRDSRHLAQQIGRLLKDPAMARRLGESAQAKAKELLWDKIAADLKVMYASVLNTETSK